MSEAAQGVLVLAVYVAGVAVTWKLSRPGYRWWGRPLTVVLWPLVACALGGCWLASINERERTAQHYDRMADLFDDLYAKHPELQPEGRQGRDDLRQAAAELRADRGSLLWD